mmetsp:Transcript_71918/g.142571  ORF Transcript_71918/g.142571 Transcript_71918/m.142571 type:complete len:92 (+) Transcript_71918:3-278(+)
MDWSQAKKRAAKAGREERLRPRVEQEAKVEATVMARPKPHQVGQERLRQTKEHRTKVKASAHLGPKGDGRNRTGHSASLVDDALPPHLKNM